MENTMVCIAAMVVPASLNVVSEETYCTLVFVSTEQ